MLIKKIINFPQILVLSIRPNKYFTENLASVKACIRILELFFRCLIVLTSKKKLSLFFIKLLLFNKKWLTLSSQTKAESAILNKCKKF